MAIEVKAQQITDIGTIGLVPVSAPFDPWIYDTDGDGYVAASEKLIAIDDYYAGVITLDQLNQVLALPEPPSTFDPWVYDVDGSCYIEIGEQLAAVSDYTNGLITLDQFNEVKYLYENNIRNPACP